MNRGHEEAEWFRLSNLMAFVANRLRFSDRDPVVRDKDLDPFRCAANKPVQQKTAKEQMAGLWARNSNLPIEHWKQQPDGTWTRVDPPKEEAK